MKNDNELPDPKLVRACQEIKDICNKYDIGSCITLASQTHGEYLVHFPKWSKCQFEEGADGEYNFRFKAKRKDDDGSLRSTVYMLQVFHRVTRELSHHYDQMLEMLEAKMFIGGGPKKL